MLLRTTQKKVWMPLRVQTVAVLTLINMASLQHRYRPTITLKRYKLGGLKQVKQVIFVPNVSR